MEQLITIILFICGVIFFLIVLYVKNIATVARPLIFMKKRCSIKKQKYGKRNIYIIKSKTNNSSDKIIFYIHGGAYVANMNKNHWRFFNNICNDLGVTIIAPDYPLVPMNTADDVFDMIEPLYSEVIEKYGKHNVILMGDSAGGTIALALLEENKSINPSKTILISPWLDIHMTNEEILKVEKYDKELNKKALDVAAKLYTKKCSKEFLASPLYGPLENLENIIIYTGTYDILNPDVCVFKKKIDELGINSIKIKEVEKAIHIWILKKKSYMQKESYIELKNDIIK